MTPKLLRICWIVIIGYLNRDLLDRWNGSEEQEKERLSLLALDGKVHAWLDSFDHQT